MVFAIVLFGKVLLKDRFSNYIPIPLSLPQLLTASNPRKTTAERKQQD